MSILVLEHQRRHLSGADVHRDDRKGRVTRVCRDGMVVKEFVSEKSHKREWVTEYEVANHLHRRGVSVPRCYGYQMSDDGAVLYKEFIPGSRLAEPNLTGLQPVAQLFVAIHSNNVITRDAHDGNLLQGKDGQLYFIDFGKSRLFEGKGLEFWLSLSREMHFIRKKLLHSRRLFARFLHYYLLAVPRWLRPLLASYFGVSTLLLGLRDHWRGWRKQTR